MLRVLTAALIALGCASSPTDPSGSAVRTYRMGFSTTPPRLTTAEVLRTADSVAKHADASLMVVEIPWAALLADTSASVLIRRDQLQLAQLLKARGLPLTTTLDVTDGLNRAAEAPALVQLGRSIAEPAVQRVYREYAAAFDSIVRPERLALAMEVNLVRRLSPSIYSSVVLMTNAAAQQIRAAGSATPLMVSVQVEDAWGRFSDNVYVGIQRDRTDFPFIQALGLSSYPYLGGFATPEEIPLDYYSRLVAGAPLPMLVVEGGWTSGSAGTVTSSPALQARYIARQMQLADAAQLVAIFQITFTDLDMTSYVVPAGSILPLFALNGLVDADYRPKPALGAWDAGRGRALAP
jgi:hypothetical protein